MTTAYIKNLIDCNGDTIYPQTTTSAVYDDNGDLFSDVMAYRSISTRSTLLASNWNSSTKIYSFESDYPSYNYDIDVKIDSDNCTDEQLDAWIAAKPLGSLTNKINARGDLPSIDIPVIITTTYNPKPLPFLSFLGNEDFTLKTYNTTKNWDGTLEYSTDKSTWNTWDGTEISSSGNNLYLRGTGNTKITGNSSDYRFVFTGSANLKIACEGNIESLLDYKTVSVGAHPTMAEYCYNYMFRNCTSLTTAPELPATTLADYCYQYMFYNCASLILTPKLPATTLNNYCYRGMFVGCISLTTAPKLPATTLAGRCYSNMFDGCTSLTSVPELPATTLANYCYQNMFYNCTSLTSAPVLPATTLANFCYQNMFSGCTSLTSAPELPATTLVSSCYSNMFNGCTNIKLSSSQTGEYQTVYRIPTSGTGTTAANALASMFASTGGTFTGTPEINTTYYTSNTVV